MSTQLKKGVLEMVVLNKIAQRDTYGYDIYQEISSNMAISESTIYPILRKLTKEGLCETYLRESSEGPPRKYFKITRQGKRRIEVLRVDWTKFQRVVNLMIRSDRYE
ncbi:Transcriptional regulator PadR-like family protein [Candidatus Izimaplasma bacterium HR1]|jgi:PadR family transcriptional regulator PadR|uniref:PadR family transcriptional regulator n=1 Tax=Candidatus Izimoplasma sp. HR1 TaxID=1541959 RepID=UPI0004F68B9A|nr:Transcriptional regulator PadR-like family protein [Candidatus Izimaplasma bacterium HR1]